MSLIQTLILATVEGVTEFLPISSTAHLVLTSWWLNINQTDFVKSFEIAIQLGAILAVVWETRKALKSLKTLKTIFLAFLPTGILGLVFYKLVKNYLLGNLEITIWALFLGGAVMILLENLKLKIFNLKSNSNLLISQLNLKQSLIIGLIQSVSMIPGVSRAMATIFGGMAVGLSRKEATEFSFLLAIPTMAAATGFDLVKSGWNFNNNEWVLLGVGFAGAFITAWLVVKWLTGYVQKHNFTIFGWYRIILAGICWWFLK